MVYTATTGPLTEIPVEADLGMFGRTGAPTKRGPQKKTKKLKRIGIECDVSTKVALCIAARVLSKMSMMTTVRVA